MRKKLHYEPDDYFSNYVLTYLMEQEISANSELVKLLKDGTPRVTKKALRAKYGSGKRIAVEITKRHPEILAEYRAAKSRKGPAALDHDELASSAPGAAAPDWDGLLGAVLAIAPGREQADEYHRAIQALLTPLFHPNLVMPERESALHQDGSGSTSPTPTVPRTGSSHGCPGTIPRRTSLSSARTTLGIRPTRSSIKSPGGSGPAAGRSVCSCAGRSKTRHYSSSDAGIRPATSGAS